MNITSDTPVIIQTQTERRIAILEAQLREACATITGLKLALQEAQKIIDEERKKGPKRG